MARQGATWTCRLGWVTVERQGFIGSEGLGAARREKLGASEVAHRLGMTTTTLYAYVNGDGSLKQAGQDLLESMTERRGRARHASHARERFSAATKRKRTVAKKRSPFL